MNFKEFPLLIQKNKKFNKFSELKNFYVNNNTLFRKSSCSTSALYSNIIEKKLNGYLYEIVLFGLNYHAKRIKYFRKQFYVDLQKSHRILLDENLYTPFKTKIYKRRLVLFGYNIKSLINTINLIKSKKPQNSYFGHGAIANFDKFKLKHGKITQK